LEEIDGTAFWSTGLREIEFEAGNCPFFIDGGLIFHRANKTAVCYFGSSKQVVIPSTVEIIGIRCFSSRDYLSRVTFESPSCVRLIEEEAFSHCVALKTVSIPASVEVIGSRSFTSCQKLRSVLFEAGSHLRRIEESAFAWVFLRSIAIPPVRPFIHDSAFGSARLDEQTLEGIWQLRGPETAAE
jgi:hypothetical protein